MTVSPSTFPEKTGTARIDRTGEGALAIVFAGVWRVGSVVPSANALIADLATTTSAKSNIRPTAVTATSSVDLTDSGTSSDSLGNDPVLPDNVNDSDV